MTRLTRERVTLDSAGSAPGGHLGADAEWRDRTAAALDVAHGRARRAFLEMLYTRTYSDPNHPLTKAYVAAERVVDELLVAAQGEAAFAAMDALVAEDAAGDHHFYPAGVGR